MTVTSKQLTNELRQRAGLTHAKAREVFKALFDANDGIIAQHLMDEKRVQFVGLGVFEVKTTPPRRVHMIDPVTRKTGVIKEIGERKRLTFRVGTTLRRSLNP